MTYVKNHRSIMVAMLKGHQPARAFTLRKNGKWVEVGEAINQGGTIRLGVAEDYLDPSF